MSALRIGRARTWGQRADPAKTSIHECIDCGVVSRLRVNTAIARWQSADEDNYREHMWR